MDIEGLKKLAEAAEPKEWKCWKSMDAQPHRILGGGREITAVPHDGSCDEKFSEAQTACAEFIAAANPEAVLALIGQVESLQQKCNHIMSEHGKRLEEVARLQRELEEARSLLAECIDPLHFANGEQSPVNFWSDLEQRVRDAAREKQG